MAGPDVFFDDFFGVETVSTGGGSGVDHSVQLDRIEAALGNVGNAIDDEDLPAASDVRLDVDRGNGELGTLIVPSQSDVRQGVAVDNTVGTLDDSQLSSPPSVSLCRVAMRVTDQFGDPSSDWVTIELVDGQRCAGGTWAVDDRAGLQADDNGVLTVDLLREATYRIRRSDGNETRADMNYTVPNEQNAILDCG